MDMIFKLKRTKSKWCKEWYDASKQYRIVCTKRVGGIKITPHYQALVRVKLPTRVMWDFAERHGPYKTLKRATEACMKHRRLWESALGAKSERELLRVLEQLPVGVPEWVAEDMSPTLLHILMDNAK